LGDNFAIKLAENEGVCRAGIKFLEDYASLIKKELPLGHEEDENGSGSMGCDGEFGFDEAPEGWVVWTA